MVLSAMTSIRVRSVIERAYGVMTSVPGSESRPKMRICGIDVQVTQTEPRLHLVCPCPPPRDCSAGFLQQGLKLAGDVQPPLTSSHSCQGKTSSGHVVGGVEDGPTVVGDAQITTQSAPGSVPVHD